MKRMISCLFATLAIMGCEPVLIGELTSDGTAPGQSSGDVASGPDKNISVRDSSLLRPFPEETLTPKTLYVTGVEYPEGVDWQRDIGYDIEGSKLFLMKDGEKIVELPVGYDECVAIDADMHRCIDGHLYTDFSTDDETVVMVDGVEAYRYSGREMIKSMCVHDDKIYTLSVPRDGSERWYYRCDGDELQSEIGELVGGLYEDNGNVVFTYKYVGTVSDTYYMFSNTTSSTLYFNSNDREVYDVRRIDKTVNYISATDDGVVAADSDTVVTLSGSPPDYEVNLRIYYDGENRFYAGSIGDTAGVWQENELLMQENGFLIGFSLRGDNYIYVLKNNADELEAICCNGETSPWPTGTELMYETCMATDGLDYTVGLIDRANGNAPALWQNGTVTTYDFNGFFTHVDYW